MTPGKRWLGIALVALLVGCSVTPAGPMPTDPIALAIRQGCREIAQAVCMVATAFVLRIIVNK